MKLVWIVLFLAQANVSYGAWRYIQGFWGSSTPAADHPAQSGSGPSTPNTLPRSGSRGSYIGGSNSPSSGPAGQSSPMMIGPGAARGTAIPRQGSSVGSRYSYDPMASSPSYEAKRRSHNTDSASSFELRDVEKFPILYRDIEDILSVPYYYVDKSLFIKTFIEDPNYFLVFTRPRLTGKSIYASLLARFFDLHHERSPGFRRRLVINSREHAGLVQGYAGKYIVIMIDWWTSGVLAASSPHEMKRLLVEFLQRLLRDHLAKTGSSILELDKNLPKDISLHHLLSTVNLWECATILGVLALAMATAHEQQVLIIIDDYDLVLKKAGELGIFDPINEFLTAFYNATVQTAQGHIWKVAAFGTHRLKHDAPFSKTCLLGVHGPTFSEFGVWDRYQHDFSFTFAEVNEAIKENRSSLTIEDFENWYSMANPASGIIFTFHPFSVASAINNGKLDRYWTREAQLEPHQYPFSCLKDFGPGDMTQLVEEPLSPTLGWSLKTEHLSYRHDCKAVTRGQVLAWMRDEGYVHNGKVGNNEQRECLLNVRNVMLNNETGLIRAMLSLKKSDPEPLRDALEALISMKNFAGGRPTEEFPARVLTSLLHSLLGTHLTLLDSPHYGPEQVTSLIGVDGNTVMTVGFWFEAPHSEPSFVKKSAFNVMRNYRAKRMMVTSYWLNMDNRIEYTMQQLS